MSGPGGDARKQPDVPQESGAATPDPAARDARATPAQPAHPATDPPGPQGSSQGVPATPGPPPPSPAEPAALVWSWPAAAFGAACALPAAILITRDPASGIAFAFGAIPAAAVGIAGPRTRRASMIVAGLAIGLSMTLGSLLADHVLLAAGGIFGLSMGAALLTARAPVGNLLLVLAVPMVGAGLSFGTPADALSMAALMFSGSVVGWLISLLWPDRPPPPRPPAHLPSRAMMLEYGVRLGLAGATCVAIGFALDLEHKGWATTACLLVMRPAVGMTLLRAAGRAAAVSVGALVGALVAQAQPPAAVLALVVLADLAALAATRMSRWYVTGGFTTMIVLLVLTYSIPGTAPARFGERVSETLLGVGIALVFGVLAPRRATAAREGGGAPAAGPQ